MLGNKRGEVITLSLVAVCIVSALVGAFMMHLPAVNGILGFKDTKTVNTSTTTPVWLKDSSGREYLATRETVYDDTVNVKQPLIETLKGWLIVLAILCFIFPGLGLWLRAKMKAEYELLKNETTKIVKSVQAARTLVKANPDPTLITKLDATMDSIQDTSTKALVTQLKM